VARSKRTHTNVIVLPIRDQRRESPGENWVFRIVESNEALVAALGVLLESYKSVIAGQPFYNPQLISQVENILKNAQDVKWNAIR
jgi:hypothetical protein